jgi:excisionase family DNA binding protein
MISSIETHPSWPLRRYGLTQEQNAHLLDINQAGKILGLKRSTMYKLTLSGKIHSSKIGALRRFTYKDIQDYLDSLQKGGY